MPDPTPAASPEFKDKTIVCAECSRPFIFMADDQRKYWSLYEQGKFERYNEPRRCPACRAVRKTRARKAWNRRFHQPFPRRRLADRPEEESGVPE